MSNTTLSLLMINVETDYLRLKITELGISCISVVLNSVFVIFKTFFLVSCTCKLLKTYFIILIHSIWLSYIIVQFCLLVCNNFSRSAKFCFTLCSYWLACIVCVYSEAIFLIWLHLNLGYSVHWTWYYTYVKYHGRKANACWE